MVYYVPILQACVYHYCCLWYIKNVKGDDHVVVVPLPFFCLLSYTDFRL